MDYNAAAETFRRMEALTDEEIQAQAEYVLREGGPSTLVLGEGREFNPPVTPPQ